MTAPDPSLRSVFVGIDVAKDKLDLARSDQDKILTVENSPKGIAQLIKSLANALLKSIVVEATGGLERPLLDALLEAALPVALVNPGHVRHLAQAMGKLAKTDAIDARVLVEFARVVEPRLAEKRSVKQTELEALVVGRRQLLKSRTEQTNRRGATTNATVKEAIDAVLKVINEQLQSLDEQIHKLIDSDDDMRHLDELIRSVPASGSSGTVAPPSSPN
jgi:transposase